MPLATPAGAAYNARPFYPRAFRGAPQVAASAAQPAAFDWRAQVPDARDGLVISEHDCHRLLAAAGLLLFVAIEMAAGVAHYMAKRAFERQFVLA